MPVFSAPYRGGLDPSQVTLPSQQSTPGVSARHLVPGLSQASCTQLPSYPTAAQPGTTQQDLEDTGYLDLSVDCSTAEGAEDGACEAAEWDGEEGNVSFRRDDNDSGLHVSCREALSVSAGVGEPRDAATGIPHLGEDRIQEISSCQPHPQEATVSIPQVSLTQQDLPLFETPMGKQKNQSARNYRHNPQLVSAKKAAQSTSGVERAAAEKRSMSSHFMHSLQLVERESKAARKQQPSVSRAAMDSHRKQIRSVLKAARSSNVQNIIDKVIMSASKTAETPKRKKHQLSPHNQTKGVKRSLYKFSSKPQDGSLCEPAAKSSSKDLSILQKGKSGDVPVHEGSGEKVKARKKAKGSSVPQKDGGQKPAEQLPAKAKQKCAAPSDRAPEADRENVQQYIQKMLSSKPSRTHAKGKGKHPLSPCRTSRPAKRRQLFSKHSSRTSPSSPERSAPRPAPITPKARPISEALGTGSSCAAADDPACEVALSSPVAGMSIGLPPETLCTPKPSRWVMSPGTVKLTTPRYKSTPKKKPATKPHFSRSAPSKVLDGAGGAPRARRARDPQTPRSAYEFLISKPEQQASLTQAEKQRRVKADVLRTLMRMKNELAYWRGRREQLWQHAASKSSGNIAVM